MPLHARPGQKTGWAASQCVVRARLQCNPFAIHLEGDTKGHARGILAPGGHICSVDPEGKSVEMFCAGFRNPFDMSWDSAHDRLISTDNGVTTDDEINIVTAGGYYGWPETMGNHPPVEGASPEWRVRSGSRGNGRCHGFLRGSRA